MIELFVSYLKNSPFEFDLFISVNLEGHKALCEEKFKTLPRLKNLLVKITPNVGRDLAPFLIAFKDELQTYDLICHIHSKKTPHDESLRGWADYLFRNLISQEAMHNIIAAFLKDEKIGLIFPPIFGKVFPLVLNLMDIDRQNMQDLCDKMGINFTPNESNFIFSAGTMFWARPNALKSLFELNLRYEDFPKEPIPTTGTIAHAIERVLGIVAENNGYKIKCFATQKEFIDSFFATYKLFEFKRKTIEQSLIEAERIVRYECRLFGVRIFKIRQSTLDKAIKFLPIKLKRL